MKPIKLLIIAYGLFMLSCEQEKVIDYNAYFGTEGQVIVHGFISNKNGVEVKVNKSVAPDNIEATDNLPDATVKLFSTNGYLLDLLETDSGLFSSPFYFKPHINEKYYIKANAPGMDEVASTMQTVRTPVKIDTAYILQYPDSVYSCCKFGDLFYIIDDPGNEPNYYYEKIYKYSKYFDPDSAFKTKKRFYPSGVFCDTSFNGKKETRWHEKKIYMDNIDSIKIELYSLSPDLYQYLISMQEYEYTLGSPFFEQPSTVYSNINDGFGIFGGYFVDSIWIHLNDTF